MSTLATTQSWPQLLKQRDALATVHLRSQFANDPSRFQRFSLSAASLFIDYSKNLIDQNTLQLLFALARERNVESWRDRMFAGERINHTERRAVLHTALRNVSDRPVVVDGHDVMPNVRAVLGRVREFSNGVRDNVLRGHAGLPFRDVVNIGIGGSDLGPQMATHALGHYASPALRVHFVSNVDDTHLAETLKHLDPATTLFIVSSKTFTTQETMTNAASARRWLLGGLRDEKAVSAHFAAISTNLDGTSAFGIPPDRVFEFWDWVGGRYSLWSAIGLPIALSAGYERFHAMLRGAHQMDEHFRLMPLESNAPVILALLGVWYCNAWGFETHAVLPYDQYLHRLPAYLQQLDMESNGKQIDRDGERVGDATGPVVWGEPGTNGQHAFFQLLHQGTHVVPADFIVAIRGQHHWPLHHEMLLANCLAQTQALAFGKTEQESLDELHSQQLNDAEAHRLARYRSFPGNRPSTTILMDELNAESLGALIALYEHKVFVQAALWNINAFDQWGVELGKQLASSLLNDIETAKPRAGLDSSTAGLLARILKTRINP